jgi:hypothetical protein
MKRWGHIINPTMLTMMNVEYAPQLHGLACGGETR